MNLQLSSSAMVQLPGQTCRRVEGPRGRHPANQNGELTMKTLSKWLGVLWDWGVVGIAALYVGLFVGMGFKLANPPSPPQTFRVSACPPQPSKENSP